MTFLSRWTSTSSLFSQTKLSFRKSTKQGYIWKTMKRMTLLFIICNEFCERFCYYGLKSLLFAFTRSEYSFTVREATLTLHLFVSLSYLFTLFGGLLSDMFLGRYNTIVYLSAIYFTGTTLLTYSSIVSKSSTLAMAGLLMIAIGTGGIKPCVAAFGGDQFDPQDTRNLNRFFSLFYFAINIGSMASMVLTPIMSSLSCLGKDSCYPLAFGTASALLGGSIVLFIFGTGSYVIKPARKESFSMMLASLEQKPSKALVDGNEATDPGTQTSASEVVYRLSMDESVEKLLKIIRFFGPVVFFWMLYDQQSSSWVEQGSKMNTKSTVFNTPIEVLSSQMQAFNSVFVLLFIPFFSKIVYPLIESVGLTLSPVRKMAYGLVLAATSFFCSAYLEYRIALSATANERLSIFWQLPQYILLTAGEIMLNMTGLEYAYAEAPETMKSMILSIWLLTVTVGNFLVMVLSFFDFMLLFPSYNHDMWNFVIYAMLGLLAALHMFCMGRSG